jgi:hypothetical protein
MRRAQREYLLTKDHVVLARAKRLEREVDEQLEVFEMELTRRQAREKYPKLFPDSNGA